MYMYFYCAAALEERGVANPPPKAVESLMMVATKSNSGQILIKRGRGNAKSLDREKLQMPLKSG